MQEVSRRTVLSSLAGTVVPFWLKPKERELDFLRKMVLDVLEASRVKPGTNGPPGWKITNSCGFPLVTPGKGGYPAFWIRDFSMATDSGLVPSQEIRNHLFLIAKCQNGARERRLDSGAILPPYAIPDHINFDGSPVFFPGTYSAGEDQGAGPWGKLPPVDDHYEFVHIAHNLSRTSRKCEFLKEKVGDLTLLERMERAFEARETDPESGLVQTYEPIRAVGFGFCDAIILTGRLLYASLLRWRAAGELHDLTGNPKYRKIRRLIESNVVRTFKDPKSEWLLAATGIGRQPDVWGSMRAVSVIRDRSQKGKLLDTIADAYLGGTITKDAAVRHVPTNRDFSSQSAWEKTYIPKGTYQNGAYWHTATGLLFECLAQRDRELLQKARQDYMAHLKAWDFRKGITGHEAPWECFGEPGKSGQNGAYLASVALPYAALKQLKL